MIIALLADEHSSIDGESIKTVERGEDAAFLVHVDEEYEVVVDEGISYDADSKEFVVLKPQYSQTVQVETDSIGNVHIAVVNDASKGLVKYSPAERSYPLGTEVTIKVAGNDYCCLSYDKDIHNGAHPFSFAKETTIVMDSDKTVYVNYYEEEHMKFTYHMNGGLTSQGLDTIQHDFKLNASRINPNTLLDDGYFIRDGYTLESYNTQADGSGTRIGIGSRVDADLFDADKHIDLYLQWVKWEDDSFFNYEMQEDDTYSVAGYKGQNDGVLAVPGTHDGKEVSRIVGNAFEGSSFKEVILPKTMKVVEDNAFKDCKELTSILFWASLEEIYDASFAGCDALDLVRVNADIYPGGASGYGSGYFSDKVEDVMEYLKQGKRMMLGLGSSTLMKNHSFDIITNSLPNDMVAYNFSLAGATPLRVSMNVALNIIGDNDYILVSAHENNINRTKPDILFEYFEFNWDNLAYLNYRFMKVCFFNYWVTYKNKTSAVDQRYYEQVPGWGPGTWGPNAYGDTLDNNAGATEENKAANIFNLGSYDSSYFSWVNTMLSDFNKSKDHALFTFSNYNKNNIVDEEPFFALEKVLKETINGTFFDSIADHFLNGRYFNLNDGVHVNKLGGTLMSNHYAGSLPELVF